MNGSIKAIETIYRGYRFRSRLEARWAVFFDALGIRYEYEREGFDLPGGARYLPDFWLPDYEVWLEVKGDAPARADVGKVFELAKEPKWLVLAAEGQIEPAMRLMILANTSSSDGLLHQCVLSECILCGALGALILPHRLADDNQSEDARKTLDWLNARALQFVCFSKKCNWRATQSIKPQAAAQWLRPRIQETFRAARQARFEHGQSGAPS